MSGRRAQTRAAHCGTAAAHAVPQIRCSEARCRAKYRACGNCGSIGVYGTSLSSHVFDLCSECGAAVPAATLTQGASIPYAEPNPTCRNAAEGLPQAAAECRNDHHHSLADTPRLRVDLPVVPAFHTYVYEGEAND